MVHVVQLFVLSIGINSEQPTEDNAKADHMPKHTAELAVWANQDF